MIGGERSNARGQELTPVSSCTGTGSFGRVRLVKHKKTGRVFALKMLSKALVLRTKQLDHILCEKDVLEALSFPFIVNV
jgi:serine/threonine protein kinase